MRAKSVGTGRFRRGFVAVAVAVLVVCMTACVAVLTGDSGVSGHTSAAGTGAPKADATADPQKLPEVDESVPAPEPGDYLLRSWGVRKCLGASGAADGIVMEAVLDSCSGEHSTIRLHAGDDAASYDLRPDGLSAGGDYGRCLVPDGTEAGLRLRDGTCHDRRDAVFSFDAAVDSLDDPQVFRIRHQDSHFCIAVAGHRIEQRQCRQSDPMQQFVLEPRD